MADDQWAAFKPEAAATIQGDPWGAFKPEAAPSQPPAPHIESVAGSEGVVPGPLPQAFLDRVQQGHMIGNMLDKLAGTNSQERFQTWPERMVRSAITLPKDVKDGIVISGPGLRKEDFSDNPHAAEPLDTLIERSQDMAAAQLGQTAFSRLPTAGPLLDAGEGRFARPYSDADGTMRAHEVGTPPVEADFANAAAVINPAERIEAAALRSPDGEIFKGTNHGEAFVEASKVGKAGTATESGFTTSSGRFVDREEALSIAAKAEQIKSQSQLKNKDMLVAEQLDSPTESKLRELWQDQGIHPAEAAHDAATDAFLRHDLTTKGVAAETPKEFADTMPGAPHSLGAEVTSLPPDVPPSVQPTRPPGSLAAAVQAGADRLFDIGRDIQMKIAPMAAGTRDSMAMAKDFANTMRRNRWEWSRIDDDIATRFTPEQRTRMWNAADEESVARQLGEIPKPGPPIVEFRRQAADIEDTLPPVADGSVRVWRGNRPDEVGTASAFTTDLPGIALPFRKSYGGDLSYVDVPKSDLAKYENTAGTAHGIEFNLPDDLAKTARAVDQSLYGSRGAAAHMGLSTLEPAERAAVEELHTRAQVAWVRARDLGMVEGEGLPAYTPRMVINAAHAGAGEGAIPLNGIGMNLRTRTGQMLHRANMTAEETEAAMKKAMGPDAKIARDIRVLPLATAELENAIAGRSLIENIKAYGKSTGAEAVSDGAIPADSSANWFTLDHPAFKTWRPKLSEAGVVKDAEGNIIFEQVPLYIHGDFYGPLKAVLSPSKQLPYLGAAYNAMMEIKGKTMGLIMNSPMIHNAVEFGRAFPAMPTRIVKAYFDGNRAKNDMVIMREAIDSGLVPIGKRFFNQDITSVMEAPDLTPGRSWTSKVLAAVPGLFDEAAGTAVKRAIDKAGDFWHNTLLWDRIADLQMGIYTNLRGDMMGKGVDQQTASRVAAHFANRYAGALPKEAMSDAATKFANMMLFSRTFTLGNLGVMKDMLTGLPKDVMAQIERDMGSIDPKAAGYAKSMARRKAFATVALDIGLLYIGNSVMQSAINVMLGDSTLDQEAHGYAKRLKEVTNQVETHPLSLLQPMSLVERLSATNENEPGKKDRLRIGYAKDGTAIYARNPVGKIGEEFTGYLTGPLDMLRKKQGTIARPMLQVISNDKGFGRKIYDPDAETPAKYASNIWEIVKHFAKAQIPEGQIGALSDLVKGEGDPKVNALQAAGPLAGVTFSKGAPGGPAVGEYYHAKSAHELQVQTAMPDIRRQILRGDVSGAQQAMRDIGMDGAYQRWVIKTTQNPATRVSPKGMRDFYQYATPEQRARMENARSQPGPLTPQ